MKRFASVGNRVTWLRPFIRLSPQKPFDSASVGVLLVLFGLGLGRGPALIVGVLSQIAPACRAGIADTPAPRQPVHQAYS